MLNLALQPCHTLQGGPHVALVDQEIRIFHTKAIAHFGIKNNGPVKHPDRFVLSYLIKKSYILVVPKIK